MKKYIIACLALSLLVSVKVNAQSFEKGSINFDLGIGFGGYGTTQTQTSSFSLTINAFGTTAPFSFDTIFSTTDGAAAVMIPFSFEYGISDKIGLGFDFTHNNYFIDTEDKVFTESVKSFDYGLKVYYHVVNSDNFDLSLGLGFGVSSVKFKLNSQTDPTTFLTLPATEAKGKGGYFNLAFKGKYWLSESVGIFGNVGYKGYSYSSIDRDNVGAEKVVENLLNSSGSGFQIVNLEIVDELEWKLKGVNVSLGLAVKF